MKYIIKVLTDRQQFSLVVAADRPDWSTVCLHSVLRSQVLHVILCDHSIQTSTEESLTHPTQRLNTPSILSWD